MCARIIIHSGRPKTWKCFLKRKPLQIFKNVTENINNLGLGPIDFKSSIPIIHKVIGHGLATAMKIIIYSSNNSSYSEVCFGG